MCLVLAAIAGCTSAPPNEDPPASSPQVPAFECVHADAFEAVPQEVAVHTSQGTFIVQLRGDAAPTTVCNFLRYVGENFYDDTIFHRICADFVIQAGGVDALGEQRSTHAPIHNEANATGLNNTARTLAMGRELEDPDSATSHWYVNLKDHPHLDPGGFDEHGFAVFGAVVEGWSVVEAIAASLTVPETSEGCTGQPIPVNAPTIRDIRLV